MEGHKPGILYKYTLIFSNLTLAGCKCLWQDYPTMNLSAGKGISLLILSSDQDSSMLHVSMYRFWRTGVSFTVRLGTLLHLGLGNRQTSLDSLPRRANARNVSFLISLRWPIHIINPVDKNKFFRYTSHRRSTTVSLATHPSIQTSLKTTSLSDLLFNFPPWCPVCKKKKQTNGRITAQSCLWNSQSVPIVAKRWKFDLYIFVEYVRFICTRLDWYLLKFDLHVWGSIYFFTLGLIFVDVRCICRRFDLFFYGSILFCCFDIKWTSFALFVRV